MSHKIAKEIKLAINSIINKVNNLDSLDDIDKMAEVHFSSNLHFNILIISRYLCRFYEINQNKITFNSSNTSFTINIGNFDFECSYNKTSCNWFSIILLD
jgi:hypothetical protein